MTDRRSFLAGALAAATAGGLARPASAAEELRVAFIPEVATTPGSIAEKQPFIDFLSKATGRTVKLVIPTNYAATVEAIGNGSVDVAHFGALTFLKAEDRYGVKPLVQRVEDRQFHSLFITSSPEVKSLGDLRGKSFAFGDVNSTSGHLIPAKELLEAKIDPERDITAKFSGNHTATAVAVNAGQVVAGALDETVYRKLVADKTISEEKARVFHTSKPFVDYVWVARKDLDPAVAASVRNAFIGLKEPAVLALLRGTKYVPVNPAEYDSIRQTARSLKLL